MVDELLKQCKLYNKNSPKFIYNYFKIEIRNDIKNVNRDIVYKFNYLPKKKKISDNNAGNCAAMSPLEKKENRHQKL